MQIISEITNFLRTFLIPNSRNLYNRLRTHLGSGKLDSAKLSTVNVVIIPHGVEADFFKAEADLMKQFEDAGEDLANKIKSPGCK